MYHGSWKPGVLDPGGFKQEACGCVWIIWAGCKLMLDEIVWVCMESGWIVVDFYGCKKDFMYREWIRMDLDGFECILMELNGL